MKDEQKKPFRVAVASSDGIVVNRHFGRTDTFRIYRQEPDRTFTEEETIHIEPLCGEGGHEDLQLQKVSEYLSLYDAILVSRIGPTADEYMRQAGVPVYVITDYIQDALALLIENKRI